MNVPVMLRCQLAKYLVKIRTILMSWYNKTLSFNRVSMVFKVLLSKLFETNHSYDSQ